MEKLVKEKKKKEFVGKNFFFVKKLFVFKVKKLVKEKVKKLLVKKKVILMKKKILVKVVKLKVCKYVLYVLFF